MRAFLAAALILLPTSASAQSFYPNLTGERYCQLRRMGIDQKSALIAAMRENIAPGRDSPSVYYDNQWVTLDAIDLTNYILTYCPERR